MAHKSTKAHQNLLSKIKDPAAPQEKTGVPILSTLMACPSAEGGMWVAGAHVSAQLHWCERWKRTPSIHVNWLSCTSEGCLCSCSSGALCVRALHSCVGPPLLWVELSMQAQAPSTQEPCIRASGTSCASARSHCSHEWSFACAAWFQTGHGPVVGHGP